MAVEPSGKFAYAVNLNDGSVAGGDDVYGYTINATTGALTSNDGWPFATGFFTTSIAVSGQLH
jgi:hypothetical protein